MKANKRNVVGIRATGMLTRADYDRILAPLLERLLQRPDKLGVLFYLDRDFKGWELSAAWANTKFDFRLRGSLEKVAVVGAPRWEEWYARVASLVMKCELRTYQAEQLGDAWEWMRS